jgi:hypothetical protein
MVRLQGRPEGLRPGLCRPWQELFLAFWETGWSKGGRKRIKKAIVFLAMCVEMLC